jgi:endonuclease-3
MKQPVDIDEMARRIEAAVRPYPKAAMVELADMGLTSSFEQLVACIVSIRTYDEVSLNAAQCLLASARVSRDGDARLNGDRSTHPQLDFS